MSFRRIFSQMLPVKLAIVSHLLSLSFEVELFIKKKKKISVVASSGGKESEFYIIEVIFPQINVV